MLALVAGSALLGLVVGSFLNVVIHRVPLGQSVVRPASACPVCATPIRPRDNIPVAGWLLLRGACRTCAAPIAKRYPLVELGTGALFAVAALRFGYDAALPAYLYLAAVGVALGLIDVDHRRLPDALTLPSYPVAAILLGLAALAGSDSGSWPRAALGALAMYAVYFALVFAYPAGMGLGDVKLAGVLGAYCAWLGWGSWAVGLFLAFLLGGLFGLGLIVAGKGGRKSAVPFGPFMLLGTGLAVLVGERLASAYLSVSGS